MDKPDDPESLADQAPEGELGTIRGQALERRVPARAVIDTAADPARQRRHILGRRAGVPGPRLPVAVARVGPSSGSVHSRPRASQRRS